MSKSLLALILALFTCTASWAQLPSDTKRILFLGDSITYAGGYIACLESAWIVQHPHQPVEFLNLGLPSETVSGLSEPGHAGGAFPRPDLHERLQRVLEQTEPDVVVACYGMNDGIYYPLSEERFEKFQSGLKRLHDAVTARGAKIIHLTPAFFDALPIRDRLLPAGLSEYLQPFEGYDEVLEAYSQWLLDQRDHGWEVHDVHSAMKAAVQASRKSNPNFTFASDGVHPNVAGQVVIARPLADAWQLRIDEDGLPDHPKAAEILKEVSKRQEILKHAWLTKTGHVRPGIPEGLPLDQAQSRALEVTKQIQALGRQGNDATGKAASGKPFAGEPAEENLGVHGYADSQGTQIHFVAKGSGPLVVMIHGFPDYWYTWRNQIPALAENHTVVAIDQRGYNWSDQPDGVEAYKMENLVDDVRAVVRHFKRDEAIIVGHDWGGMVAWQFAMRYPEITSRLVVLNLPHPNGLRRELASNEAQQKNSAYARFFQTADAAKMVQADTLVRWVKDPNAKSKYLEAMKRSSMEGMLNYYKANYPREPYTAPTEPGPRVKCPVLMFHGLKDQALLADALNGTWQWLDRELTLVTIPDADHFVQHDAPEQVTRTMVKWLQP